MERGWEQKSRTRGTAYGERLAYEVYLMNGRLTATEEQGLQISKVSEDDVEHFLSDGIEKCFAS